MRPLLLLGLSVAVLFVSLMLWTTHGHFVAPVTDLYVVAQYARAMAEGHPFRYSPGEPPTSGSTSLLHTALLAAGHAAGARGEGLIALAVALGAGFLLLSTVLAVRVASRLASRREGLLAGALVALGGPLAWGYMYGSDIALAMLLAILLLDRWLAWAQGEGVRGLAAAGALLALARPEGLLVGLLLGGASLLAPMRRGRWPERLLPWAGALTGLGVLALQRWVTGAWLATSVSEKALLPNYGPVGTLAAASKYGVDVIRGVLLGFYPAESPVGFSQGHGAFAFPPLGLLLVLLVAAHPPAAAPPVKAALRAWLVIVAVTFALTGPNLFMGVHFNRYLMWAFPGLVALAAAGLGVASRLLARDDDSLERRLFAGGAALFVLLGGLSTLRFAAAYAEMAGETWRREIPMAAWIRSNLPRGVHIANAATSIEYLTGHRNLNLHGVTSAWFLGTRSSDREAGMFEALERLPAAERPPWLLLTRSGLDSSDLFQAVAAGPPVHETASLGDDLLLVPAKWDILGRGSKPLVPEVAATVSGLALVDELDTCDAHDESAHRYDVETRMGELPLAASLEIDALGLPAGSPALADAGRLVAGRERFVIRTRPGQELTIVLRTRGTLLVRTLTGRRAELALGEARLGLGVGGQAPLPFALPVAGGWREHVLRVPASFVRTDATTLELSGRYPSFHYWFYQ